MLQHKQNLEPFTFTLNCTKTIGSTIAVIQYTEIGSCLYVVQVVGTGVVGHDYLVHLNMGDGLPSTSRCDQLGL